MTLQDIKKFYNKSISLVLDKKINQSIEQVMPYKDEFNINDTIQFIKQTYKLMLKYSFGGMKDPNRDKIFNQIQITLLTTINIIFKKLLIKNNFLFTIKEPINQPSTMKMGEKIANKWFDFLVYNDSLDSNLKSIIEQNISDNDVKESTKCLIISGLTYSSIINFDIEKLDLLADIYLKNQDNLWQRSLVGIVMIFNRYSERIKVFEKTKIILEKLSSSENFEERYEAVVAQLIRATDTERINRKLREELMPEVSKNMPDIDDKIFEEQNPDWQEYFENNPNLLDKMQEFSKMQLEGADLFISTFSQLKNFRFFFKNGNWFAPFEYENEDVQQANLISTKDFDIKEFAKKLEKSPFICNSDKYSFLLSVNVMPESQKQMLKGNMGQGIDQLKEISDENRLVNKKAFDYQVITTYIHDLYRFFTLSAEGKLFSDVFSKNFINPNCLLFNQACKTSKQKRKIAEYFFNTENYTMSSRLYESISNEDINYEILQKKGYCYQKNNDFEKALKTYLQADYIQENQSWTIKKIAFCYKKLSKLEKAIKYYKKAEELEPENINITNSLAKCYEENNQLGDALNSYFKSDYLQSKNSTQRQIVRLCLKLEKYEQAKRYLDKLHQSKKILDIDNYLFGHYFRLIGDVDKGIEYYKEASKSKTYKEEEFLESMQEFVSEKQQEKAENNNLIFDYIKFSLDEDNDNGL